MKSDDLAQVAWDAIAPLWNDLPYSNSKKLEEFLSLVTEGQKALISIDWCQKEIRNGGIKQLFTNSTGNLVPYAIIGFKEIGALEYANVLEAAANLLGKPYPVTASKRKSQLKLLTSESRQHLEKLDDSFFKLLQSKEHDLEKFRGNYVKNNPAQFIES